MGVFFVLCGGVTRDAQAEDGRHRLMCIRESIWQPPVRLGFVVVAVIVVVLVSVVGAPTLTHSSFHL